MAKEILICAATRTAIGSFSGSLASMSGPELGAEVIKSVLERGGLKPESIDEVIMGCVLTANQGQAPARQAALKAGLPNTVQAMTINKVCSSGLKAVMLAANTVELGHARSVIAGGFESMSQVPYVLPAMRGGARLGDTKAKDILVGDGLWDPYNDYHMGNAAELCAKEHSLSREAQDEFALESYRRAGEAIQAGHFKEEITAVNVKAGRKEFVFEEDEEPGNLKAEKVPSLRPVFQKEGTVTAANASSLNDGASAMLVCDEDFAKENSLTPLVRIVSQGWKAQEPERFTTAPVGAVEMSVQRAGLKIDDIDLFEINEAFSAVSLACQGLLKVDGEKVNVSGGAVALGHPIGASGARILTTLIYNMHRLSKKYGAVGICNGGGEATSIVVEKV